MVSNSFLRSKIQTEQRPLNLAKRLLPNLLTESGFGRVLWTLEGSREGRGREIEAPPRYHQLD